MLAANSMIKSKMASMSLRDKVAQLFTFSALSAEGDDSTLRMITELKVGGMFLGMECLKEPKQVHRLTTAMQQASMALGSGIPLFISADFVAGAGCKLNSGAVHFPKNRAIGAAGDIQLAYESGKATALESLSMGVNFNYSPVVDINNNPLNPVIGTHSFGDEPLAVSKLGCAVIEGYQNHGMIATAKHFPGHGDTSVDSHEDLPVLPFDRDRLMQFELLPFARAIEAGVDAIMVGHIAVPEWDPSYTPASLSKPLTTGLLREKMNFQGLIVTDGLSMKGITNQYTMEEACIHAVLAGADILLATANTYEGAASMFEAVVEAVKAGTIPAARIEESLVRILEMKQKYKLEEAIAVNSSYSSHDEQSLMAERVSMELALKAATPLAGMTQGIARKDVAWLLLRDSHTSLFAEELRPQLPLIEEQIFSSFEQVQRLLEALPDEQSLILALSHNKPLDSQWLEQLNRSLSKAPQAIWVHFGSEYDTREAAVPCLLMYDRAPSLQRAAAQFLCQVNPSQ